MDRIMVAFDPLLPQNKNRFDNLRAYMANLAGHIAPIAKAGKRIKTTGKTSPRIDRKWLAQKLGVASSFNTKIVSAYDFQNFCLTLIPNTEFKEENGELIFTNGNLEMHLLAKDIIRVFESGKILWERK